MEGFDTNAVSMTMVTAVTEEKIPDGTIADVCIRLEMAPDDQALGVDEVSRYVWKSKSTQNGAQFFKGFFEIIKGPYKGKTISHLFGWRGIPKKDSLGNPLPDRYRYNGILAARACIDAAEHIVGCDDEISKKKRDLSNKETFLRFAKGELPPFRVVIGLSRDENQIGMHRNIIYTAKIKPIPLSDVAEEGTVHDDDNATNLHYVPPVKKKQKKE